MKDTTATPEKMQTSNTPITVGRKELSNTLNTLSNASEAFSQLETLLQVIAQKADEHSAIRNLAKIGCEIAGMWSNIADVEHDDFNKAYVIDEQSVH